MVRPKISNNIKIRRLEHQVEEYKELLKTEKKESQKQIIQFAIERREEAIQYLEGNPMIKMSWEELSHKFKFKYFLDKYYN